MLNRWSRKSASWLLKTAGCGALIVLLVLIHGAFFQAPIVKNIVTDFGASCTGSGNDSAAFNAANAAAQAGNPTQFILQIPQGAVCNITTATLYIAKGVKNMTVIGLGTGATIQGSGAGLLWLGGNGVATTSGFSARLQTANAGSSTVTLITPAQTSLFTSGTWAIITGIDMQGAGSYPPNPYYFEYVQISSIGTGTISFAAPLVNTYLSTWPLYSAGSGSSADQGGPATLYVLDPTWDTTVLYQNLTIIQAGDAQIYSPGRSITFNNVIFTGTQCIVPTENLSYTVINGTMAACDMEVDKMIDTLTITGTNINQLLFQSASVNRLFLTGGTVNSTMNGTPKVSLINGTSFANFGLGALAYGPSTSTVCIACSFATVTAYGVEDTGGAGNPGVNVTYSMSGGVLTVPNADGPVRWAIPGSVNYWQGQYTNEGFPFTVGSLTQDASNTYVTMVPLPGGFPSIPPVTVSSALYIRSHPAPKFTCISCTGSAIALDLSQAPAGAPLFSYSKRTFAGNILTSSLVPVWGRVVSIKINVTTPYTGVQSTLTMNAMGQFFGPTLQPSGTLFDYAPIINLKTAGLRTITPSGVTGAQTGDSGLSIGAPIWITQGYQPVVGTNIGSENPSVYPSVTIEFITDQNIMGTGCCVLTFP